MSFRTPDEAASAAAIAHLFDGSSDNTADKLATFARYARRQDLGRFLSCYEIFRRVVNVKGSIVECGVFRGQTLMSWLHLSTILEPENLTRRIYGFDSFEGLTRITDEDQSAHSAPRTGDLSSNSLDELRALVEQHDRNRFLGHIRKVGFVPGDATETIPEFIRENPHVVISLLFLDLDLYEPTRVALEHFLPRMPRGAVLAFDELDNPIWPGETRAALDAVGLRNLRLERLPWDPYIAFAVLD